MGTNFYWVDAQDEYVDHIGKRSAAGWYCYDCCVSLCKGGEAQVHSGVYGQYDRCRQCGKGKQEDGYNGAMVELGFEKPPQPPQRPKGVQGASSFTWAQEPEGVIARCNASLFAPVIEDEYGRTYTGQQFLWLLESTCPIRFTHSIGVAFS